MAAEAKNQGILGLGELFRMLVLEKWPKIEISRFGLKKAVLGRFLLKSRFFQVKTLKNALLRPTEHKVKISYFPYRSPAKKAQKGHIWP